MKIHEAKSVQDQARVVVSAQSQEDLDATVNKIQSLVNSSPKGNFLRPSPGTKIYMDVNNFNSSKFFRNWNITQSVRNVEKFIDCVKQADCVLIGFFDGGRSTDEAKEKFKKRRLAEVRKGERRIPQNSSWMVAEAFTRKGVEIRYSSNVDNDHTLAYYAHQDGAVILSGDQDFFRYYVESEDGKKNFDLFLVFRDFHLKGGRLTLEKALKTVERDPLQLPKDRPLYSSLEDNSNLYQSRINMNGNPTPLIKRLGSNPHAVIRPLRLTVYHAILGEDEEMLEMFPVFVNGSAEFVEETVKSKTSPEMEALLKGDPIEGYKYFFPEEAANHKPGDIPMELWDNHKLGCFAVVLEQYCFYRSQVNEPISFLDRMLDLKHRFC